MTVLVGGCADGEVVYLEQGLSFWGGYDPETGTIVDRSHPQLGQSLAGKIVVMPYGRGSSSSSSVLAEALRLGTGPAGIILGEPDSILVVGSLVARMLYGVECPIHVGEAPETSGGRIRLGQT